MYQVASQLCHGEGNNIFPLLHFGRQRPDSRSAYLPNCHLFLSSLRPLFRSLVGANLVPPNPNILQSPSSVVLIDRPTYPTTTNRSKILSGFSCVKERGFRMLEVDARSVRTEARGALHLFFILSYPLPLLTAADTIRLVLLFLRRTCDNRR